MHPDGVCASAWDKLAKRARSKTRRCNDVAGSRPARDPVQGRCTYKRGCHVLEPVTGGKGRIFIGRRKAGAWGSVAGRRATLLAWTTCSAYTLQATPHLATLSDWVMMTATALSSYCGRPAQPK